MNHIKKFNESWNESDTLFEYLNDNISEEEFINESRITESVGGISDKILQILNSIIDRIKSIKISKVLFLINWVLKNIKESEILKPITRVCFCLILFCVVSINASGQERLSNDELKQVKDLKEYVDTGGLLHMKNLSMIDMGNITQSGMAISSGYDFLKKWLEDVQDGQFDGDKLLDKRYNKAINNLGFKLANDITSNYSKEIKNKKISNKFKQLGNKVSSVFRK